MEKILEIIYIYNTLRLMRKKYKNLRIKNKKLK